jgi:predicted acetyltransferase
MKPQVLGDGLVVRNACTEDIPALLKHFRVVHGKGVTDELRAMLEHYPRFSWEDSFVIVSSESGEVVSCIILVQNYWFLDGVKVPSVEMEAVGTLVAYRYRGHMRILNDAFEQRAAELEPVIQTIAGIPNFYRNFGYEYAAPLGGGYPVTPNLLPKLKEEEVEPVTFEEVDAQSFDEFRRNRESHSARGTWNRTWHRELHPEDSDYLIFETTSIEQETFEFYLVKKEEKTVGVFYLSRWEDKVDITELYLDDYEHLDSVLRFAITRAKEWGEIPLRILMPNQAQVNEFVKVRTQCKEITRYAWYVKIPSVPRFITTIGPLFKDRLIDTSFNDYSESLTITDYKQGYELFFEEGVFQGVSEKSEKNVGEYHLRIPKGALTRLLMGYETLDELMSHEPDVICISGMKPLVRLLFPKLNAIVDPFY